MNYIDTFINTDPTKNIYDINNLFVQIGLHVERPVSCTQKVYNMIGLVNVEVTQTINPMNTISCFAWSALLILNVPFMFTSILDGFVCFLFFVFVFVLFLFFCT